MDEVYLQPAERPLRFYPEVLNANLSKLAKIKHEVQIISQKTYQIFLRLGNVLVIQKWT